MNNCNVQYTEHCVNAILNINRALLEDYMLLLAVTFTLRNTSSSLLSPSGKLTWGLKSALRQIEQL